MPADLEKWANKQIAVMVGFGRNVLDAQKAVRAFLALLPPGADPDTWTPTGQQMEQDISRQEYADDAVAAWVARDDMPSQYKLIIVAGDDSR